MVLWTVFRTFEVLLVFFGYYLLAWVWSGPPVRVVRFGTVFVKCVVVATSVVQLTLIVTTVMRPVGVLEIPLVAWKTHTAGCQFWIVVRLSWRTCCQNWLLTRLLRLSRSNIGILSRGVNWLLRNVTRHLHSHSSLLRIN